MNWYERFYGEKNRMKDSHLHAHVVVKTSNLVVSRRRYAEDLKNICYNPCGTCSTIIYDLLTNDIILLWRCCCRCRRRFLNSLIIIKQRHQEEKGSKGTSFKCLVVLSAGTLIGDTVNWNKRLTQINSSQMFFEEGVKPEHPDENPSV